MPNATHLHAQILQGHAWPAWLCQHLIAATHAIRIYVHRLAAPPSYPNAPLTPVWHALCAPPARGVTCQLLSPLHTADNARSMLNRAATTALATRGWHIRYCAGHPCPQSRLYLFDDVAACVGDFDLLNSHLTATHLHGLELREAGCCAPIAAAFAELWTAARLTP